MKRILWLALSAWLCLGVGGAWAGMTGGPGAMPGQGRWAADLQGAWLFSQDYKDRNATVTRGSASYPAAIKDSKITDDRSVMASLAYGVSDRFSLYAKLGVMDGGTFKFSNWDGGSGTWWSNKFKLKTVFTWALGAKFRAWESAGGLGLWLAAQYQRYDDRKAGDMESQGHGNSLNDFQADYWQADLAAMVYQKLGPLTPYVGLGYEHAELSIAGRANLGTPYANHIDFGDMKNQDSLNVLMGLTWKATSNLSLTLRGAFLAQNTVSLGVAWAF